jgi:hypothetical protein
MHRPYNGLTGFGQRLHGNEAVSDPVRVNHIGLPTAEPEARSAAQPIDRPRRKDPPLWVNVKRKSVQPISQSGMQSGMSCGYGVVRGHTTADKNSTVDVEFSERLMQPHGGNAGSSLVGDCDVQDA